MPLFEVRAPDGGLYEISTPEGGTEKDAIRFLQNQLASESQREEVVVPPPVGETGFIPSVKRGAIGLQSLVADVAPAMAGRVAEKLGIPGAGEYATAQMQEAAAKQERAQRLYPAAVPSYTDIRSGGDLYNYVVESVGELIPSMIPSILTGGAAGIAGRGAIVAAEQAAKQASMEAAKRTMLTYSGSKLGQEELVNLARAEAIKAGQAAANKVALKYEAAGALGGSAIQNIPEVYQNVAQETGKEDLGSALLFGGFNSVLDAVTPLKLLRSAKGKGLTENELIGAWYKRGAKGLGTGFLTEGATEALQEMSSAAAEKFVDQHKEFFTPQNFERFINAGLKGGIGGGAASGAANVAFGRKEAKEVPPTEAAAAAEEVVTPTEPLAPEGRLSKEEALAKVMAAAGKKPEEVADVNKPTFTPPSGVSPEVPGEPGGAVAAEGAGAPRAAGVADVTGPTSLIEGGERTEQRPLTEEVAQAAKPEEVVAPPVAEEKPAEVKPEEIAPEAAAAVANEPADFLDWITAKGYSLTDGSLDWPGLELQWKAETGQAAPVETKVEEAKVEEAPKAIPVAKPAESEAQRIAKSPRTKQQQIKKQQNIKAEQAKVTRELAKDTKMTVSQKAAKKAAQNYLIAADNDETAALRFLGFDLAVGAKGNKGAYKPGTGGQTAKDYYASLNLEQKAIVDAEKAKWEKIEAKTEKDIEDRNTIQKTKKAKAAQVKKESTKKVKESTKSLEDIIADIEQEENSTYTYYDLSQDLAFNKDQNMFGGTTPDFMGALLHGDLHGALEEIVSDKSGAFTPLDKEVAKRLLTAKSLPAVEVVDSLPENAHGAYNNGTDTVYIASDALNSHILLHEALHGHTVSMIRAWQNKEITNKGLADLNTLYEYLKANHPELATEYGIKEDLAEFASEVMSNRNFQDQLKKIPYQRSNVFTEFARAILRILGISPTDRFTALASALVSIDSALTTGRQFQETQKFAPETVKYEGKAQRGPLKPELRAIDSYEEWVKAMPEAAPAPSTQTIKKAFTTAGGAKELARLFQNERYPIKNWQDLLELAGKVVHAGDDQTNIYTQISLATGRAEDEFLVNMYDPSTKLYAAIGEYSKAKGIEEDQALKELQAVFVALHERERRETKYLMTVPLTADAAAQRKAILELVRSNKIDEDTARTLRSMLNELVANNKMEKGFDDEGPSNRSLDIESDEYNVAGIRTKVIQETLAKQYEPNKALIDPIREALQKVHDVTIDLNKRGNYWSQPVSNIVAFYGFKNYVPLKGRPGETLAKVDDLLNFDSQYNGREMQEATYAYEGRVSESDNVLLQSLSDGVRAAMRAGRGGTAADGTQFGISQAVKNAINKKLLDGRRIKTIKFEDRYKVGGDEALRAKGESIFFHYNPDGSIEIYEISDKRLREAIRRTYRTSQPLLDAANNITSFLGQLHTRYNVAFAPMNFIRDTLTNAFTMGAEMGPGTVGAIASKVVQGGLGRAMKVSRLYNKGKFDEIKALGEKDPYIKAMYEYIQQGGKVSYVQGIGSQSQFEKLQENIGRKGIATTKEQIDGVLDLWTNMFEFASRTAAYQVAKDKFMQEGLPENEAIVKATGYVKNLANFEQVGVWGKQLGSLFTFFRPSATGAVRAIESLVPLFRDVDKALLNLPESVRFLVDKDGKFVKDDKGERIPNHKVINTFRQNMEQQRRSAMAMAMSLAGAGAMIYLMAVAMADDDDEGRNKVATDDMARWSRYARFHVPGTDVVFQIPWGFGLGAFAAAGAQVMAFGIGKNSLKDTFNNIKDIGFDSFLPLPVSKINMWENPAAWAMDSATPSVFRPFLEYTMNMDGLGREIYNNRQSRYGDAYTGGDNIPDLYKDAARMLANVTNGGMDVSPNTMYFFANNYADGLTRLVHNSYNVGLVAAGQKEFNPKTDTILFDSFFGAKSNYDAKQFSKVENQIKDMERKLNMFKSDPVRYNEYIADHPFDQGIVDAYNKAINGDLKTARALANQYRMMPDLTPKERKELLENVKEQQNLIKRHLISVFEAYDITP